MNCFSDFLWVSCLGCIECSTSHYWKVLIATIRFCSVTPSLSSNTAMSTKSLILSSTVWLLELSLHMKKKILTKWFQIVSTSHPYRCELSGTIFSWNNKNSINKSISESALITVLLCATTYNCWRKMGKMLASDRKYYTDISVKSAG